MNQGTRNNDFYSFVYNAICFLFTMWAYYNLIESDAPSYSAFLYSFAALTDAMHRIKNKDQTCKILVMVVTFFCLIMMAIGIPHLEIKAIYIYLMALICPLYYIWLTVHYLICYYFSSSGDNTTGRSTPTSGASSTNSNVDVQEKESSDSVSVDNNEQEDGSTSGKSPSG